MPKVHYRVAAQRRLRHAAGDAFLSALLTRSSRRRLNGFSGVSQYRVEDGPPPLLQRSRPKVPVDYSLVDGLSLVAGFHTSKSLCARARLVTLRQTFVRRRQNCGAMGRQSSRGERDRLGLGRLGNRLKCRSCQDRVFRSLAGHHNRGIDGVFEIVRVVGRALVSIAEVHAIIARAHLAKSEPEMTSDRFSFLELHNFVKSSAGSTNEKPDTFI
jgi:hypothetical protein